jgi:glutamate dehydrogenase/leucine dehydrogenase
MFESLLQNWDGEEVIIRHDTISGAWIFIAIHSTKRGPAGGGTRFKSYPSLHDALEDVLRLSASMTFKFAIPGMNFGGGKAVIAIPQNFDSKLRPDLLHRYGALVKQLNGLYYTGPDVGTSAEDMDVIAETASPFVFGRTPAYGGAGSSGPITGIGVFAGIQTVCEHLDGSASLKGKRVLVQGVGAVGRKLIELLLDDGAEVMFNDVSESAIKHFRDELGLKFAPNDSLYATECDIFSPNALGGILNRETIPQLNCRAVAGGANNQLASPDDAARLRSRGILYAPDYVINVGGAMGITGQEALGWSKDEAEKRVIHSVQTALRKIFEIASTQNITTEDAARQVAEEQLRI